MRSAINPVIITLFIASRLWASHNHPPKPEPPPEPGYVYALAAANHFLHAWQIGDLENGMVLLSDGIRHSQNADQLETFFSREKERSFEIGRGHGHTGQYTFPVTLVSLRGSHALRRTSQITVIETGKNDWVVDKLP
jgi:hypothetical protein